VKKPNLQAMGLGLTSQARALYQRLATSGRASKTEQPLSGEDREIFQYFDGEWYLETYKDVARAGMDPIRHFLDHGEAEGRDPSKAFSTTYYRDTFMRGEPIDVSPLRHFLRVGRARGFDPRPTYLSEIATQSQSYGIEIHELLRHIQVMPIRPLFVVYVDRLEPPVLPKVRSALSNQLYTNWTLCDAKESVVRQLRQTTENPPFLVWLGHDDALHSSAFYCFASAINADLQVDVIYGDEDEVSENGDRSDPFFKPDWSPDYLESCNYLGGGTCVRGAIADRIIEASSGMYDFFLRATEITHNVRHIRHVLVHRARGLHRSKPQQEIAEEISAIEGRLQRTERTGKVVPLEPDVGCYRIETFCSDTPSISIVIPTAGRIVDIDGRKVDLILNCVNAIVNQSSFKNLEVVVVHNCDIDAVRMSKLDTVGVRKVAYCEPEINIAKKINLGVAACRGEFVLLLNDDVEPLNVDWIERLLDHMRKPHVGAVGAKLLYPNMKTQHLGIILLKGIPNGLRREYPRADAGYFFSSLCCKNFLGVTGAVMMTRASLFRQVGGYTESLPINYNDVDYCLKLKEKGAYTVFSPQAELIHYESLSRQPGITDTSEVEFFINRWAKIVTDPFYNESELTTFVPTFEVSPSDRPIG
jgi:O-antigen biosynthesis protein